MRRLLTEPGLQIVDLAFDCRVRIPRRRSLAPLRGPSARSGTSQEWRDSGPRSGGGEAAEAAVWSSTNASRDYPEHTLAGLAGHFTAGQPAEMPGLWMRIIHTQGFPGTDRR